MQRLRREMEALRQQQRELESRNVEGRVARARTVTLCEYKGGRPGGWLGISFQPPSNVRIVNGRGPLLTFTAPIAVDEVLPGSPAAKAGLAVGDSIVAFNGESVTAKPVEFDLLLRPQTTLAVRARRGGKERDFKVEVTTRPGEEREPCREVPVPMPFIGTENGNPVVRVFLEGDSASVRREITARLGRRGVPGAVIVPAAPDIPLPPRPPGFTFSATERAVVYLFGAQFGTLTEELQELTGAKKGVFVVSVADGSPAASSGLKAADVVHRVNDDDVGTLAELRRALSATERGGALGVIRKKKPVILTVNW
jgi:S1-C subfamily serine protease